VSAFEEAPDGPTRISYVSEPFTAPACVCGLVTGELVATIDRKDFDFTWALYEATPDGKIFQPVVLPGPRELRSRSHHAVDAHTWQRQRDCLFTDAPGAKQTRSRQPPVAAADGEQESLCPGELRHGRRT
jgi:predicted acyl esterase